MSDKLIHTNCNKLIHTLPPILNSIKDFPGFNFIFFFRACNVASSFDLGILLSDILNMAVTKSELGGEMFNEQFCCVLSSGYSVY